MMIYFENKIVVYQLMHSKIERQTFTFFFGVESLVFLMITFMGEDYGDYFNKVWNNIIQVFAISCTFSLTLVFLTCLYNLSSLNFELIRLEL